MNTEERQQWLQSICDSLATANTKGQTALARIAGWSHSTVWRKLKGKSSITDDDVLLVNEKIKADRYRQRACRKRKGGEAK